MKRAFLRSLIYSLVYDAKSFNQPLNNWDVSKVTNMSYMFRGARSFNQPLDNWNVSNVREMRYIVSAAVSRQGGLGWF